MSENGIKVPRGSQDWRSAQIDLQYVGTGRATASNECSSDGGAAIVIPVQYRGTLGREWCGNQPPLRMKAAVAWKDDSATTDDCNPILTTNEQQPTNIMRLDPFSPSVMFTRYTDSSWLLLLHVVFSWPNWTTLSAISETARAR